MSIWCLVEGRQLIYELKGKQHLVRELPHFSHNASHAISPLAFRCSSASFFNFSVSSSDQAPWFPALPGTGAADPFEPVALLDPACGAGAEG